MSPSCNSRGGRTHLQRNRRDSYLGLLGLHAIKDIFERAVTTCAGCRKAARGLVKQARQRGDSRFLLLKPRLSKATATLAVE
jgi:hypothetical protein